MTKNITLKIDQCAEQVHGPVRKIVGLLPPKSFNHLIDVVDLSANPRLAKKGSVTADIETTLRENAALFPAKTKGILLASTSYKSLDRQRFHFLFQDPDTEGLLDGGHNALATGRHVLREAGLDDRELSKIKDWESFEEAWKENRQAIADIEDILDFSMPIEVQVPASMTDDAIVDEFKTSLLEIGAARNNNVQLSDATKANKMGLYVPLKDFLPTTLAENVEWKSNDGGKIKVQDILALAWIPLSKLELPEGIRVNPNHIYRNKAVCVAAFHKLLTHPTVSEPVAGGYERKLNNKSVESALRVAAQFPELYDTLHARFPEAYNKAGGSFGKISAVRIYDPEKAKEKNAKYLRNPPTTPFFDKEVAYTCPDGFIVPFIYGLRALLKVEKGQLVWKTDPMEFIKKHLVDVMKSYRLVLELGTFDPQKVGKNISAYDFAESAIAANLAMAD